MIFNEMCPTFQGFQGKNVSRQFQNVKFCDSYLEKLRRAKDLNPFLQAPHWQRWWQKKYDGSRNFLKINFLRANLKILMRISAQRSSLQNLGLRSV